MAQRPIRTANGWRITAVLTVLRRHRALLNNRPTIAPIMMLPSVPKAAYPMVVAAALATDDTNLALSSGLNAAEANLLTRDQP